MRRSLALTLCLGLSIACGDDDAGASDAAGSGLDSDGDGFRRCDSTDPPGTCDCDDSRPDVNPGVREDISTPELCADLIDQNCDGVDAPCDRDADGYTANEPTGGSPDCDDTDPAINPDATEVCTALGEPPTDEDCDGRVDELEECLADDLDMDGVVACGVAAPGTPCDCNDCDNGIHPGAVDACNDLVDQDCSNGDVYTPDATPTCSINDADGDGVAAAPGGTDCDDTDPRTYPGAPERCGDGVDQDCTGADLDCMGMDADGDGYIPPADCAEGDAARAPYTTEECNGVDDDCDGFADELLLPPGPESSTGALLLQGDRGCVLDETSGRSIDYRTNAESCGGCRMRCPPTASSCNDGTCR